MKSNEFLQAAIDVQKERGAQYDKQSGERSMGATVAAFNCITGNSLKEQDGWMFLGLLKLVRQSQNPEKYHHDSALDFVAYASLYAEAASEQCLPIDDVLVLHNNADNVSAWDIAPDSATHLMYANFDIEEGNKFEFASYDGIKYYDMNGSCFFTAEDAWSVHSKRPQQ